MLVSTGAHPLGVHHVQSRPQSPSLDADVRNLWERPHSWHSYKTTQRPQTEPGSLPGEVWGYQCCCYQSKDSWNFPFILLKPQYCIYILTVLTLFLCQQEFSLEKAVQAMSCVWDNISFNHQPYRETGISILVAWDEIQTTLDDQIVKTQTMKGSPFIKPIETEIKVCFTFLGNVDRY